MKMEKKDPLYRSFGYAFQGIFTCVRKERNMKIHCVAAVLVVIAGVILKISAIEWCICMVLFGLVMALEHVNTAVEAVVDMVTEEYHPLAKVAKDTAAGAVLIAAIMAAIAGCMTYGKIRRRIKETGTCRNRNSSVCSGKICRYSGYSCKKR